MCIRGKKVVGARKNHKVYKVVKERHSVFYTLFRNRYRRSMALDRYTSSMELKSVLKSTDHHFDDSYGLTAFKSYSTAQKYVAALQKYFFIDRINLLILELTIPKGTRYVLGYIAYGFPGEGLRALRCEKLVSEVSDDTI